MKYMLLLWIIGGPDTNGGSIGPLTYDACTHAALWILKDMKGSVIPTCQPIATGDGTFENPYRPK